MTLIPLLLPQQDMLIRWILLQMLMEKDKQLTAEQLLKSDVIQGWQALLSIAEKKIEAMSMCRLCGLASVAFMPYTHVCVHHMVYRCLSTHDAFPAAIFILPWTAFS
jgi:hypothetical protein